MVIHADIEYDSLDDHMSELLHDDCGGSRVNPVPTRCDYHLPRWVSSWPEPNYDNPIRRGPGLLVAELTIMPIALLTLALRLYVRMYLLRKPGWDDWLMIAGTVCSLLAFSFISGPRASKLTNSAVPDRRRECHRVRDPRSREIRLGHHVWDLTWDQIVKGRQISIAAQTIFVFAVGLVKASILSSYLRDRAVGFFGFEGSPGWPSGSLSPRSLVFLIVLWTQCSYDRPFPSVGP